MLIDKNAFFQGGHAQLPCVACHQSTLGPEGFETVPHQKTLVNNDCRNCHAGEKEPALIQAHENASLTSAQLHISALNCVDCHTLLASAPAMAGHVLP